MAFAPMGPEASFFEVLERHRASLLAAQRGGGDPPAAGIRPASSAEVLAAIESVVEDVVRSLARREAPALALHDRASWQNVRFAESAGLQMAPHCTTRKVRSDSQRSAHKFALILKILSMIYKLVQSNTYATKRDIYYMDSQLFGSQTVVDSIIDDISCMLKVPRRSLHISSTSKGLIAGNLSYVEEDGTRVSCTCGATVVAVPSNIQGIRNLITDAKFLLIVEKDATFQRLLDDNFCSRMSPCIMVTSMCFEAHHLTVPAVRWLGLLPSDVSRLHVPKDSLIPLTKRDLMKLDSILKRPYIACQPLWRAEVGSLRRVRCWLSASHSAGGRSHWETPFWKGSVLVGSTLSEL
nr:meiotic recombination protein SPO11 isoform X6 [Oryctolagus cuniculus]